MFSWPSWDSVSEITRYTSLAEIGGIIATATAVLLSLFVFVYGGRKDTLIEQKHNKEIAELHLEAAKAKERAENAILEHERLKAKLAWRTITEEAEQQLLTRLQKTQYKVKIACVSNDAESLYFADLITQVFRKANWLITSEQRTYNNFVLGLKVPPPTTPATILVREALTAAAIPFDTKSDLPNLTEYTTSGNKITDTTIIVGSKPQIY